MTYIFGSKETIFNKSTIDNIIIDTNIISNSTGNINLLASDYVVIKKTGNAYLKIDSNDASATQSLTMFLKENVGKGFVGWNGGNQVVLHNYTSSESVSISDSGGTTISSSNTYLGFTGVTDSNIRSQAANSNLNLYANGTGLLNAKSVFNVHHDNNNSYMRVRGDVSSSIYLTNGTDTTIKGILRHTAGSSNLLQLINNVNQGSSITPVIQLYDSGKVEILAYDSKPIILSSETGYTEIVGKNDLAGSNPILLLYDKTADFVANRGGSIGGVGLYDTGASVNFGRLDMVKANSTQGNQEGLVRFMINDGSNLVPAFEIDAGKNLKLDGNTFLDSSRNSYLYSTYTPIASNFIMSCRNYNYGLRLYPSNETPPFYSYYFVPQNGYMQIYGTNGTTYAGLTLVSNTITLGASGQNPTITSAGTNTTLYLTGTGTGYVQSLKSFFVVNSNPAIYLNNTVGNKTGLAYNAAGYTILVNSDGSNNPDLLLYDNGSVYLRAKNNNCTISTSGTSKDITLDPTGNVVLDNCNLYMNTSKVVGSRITGWSTATGTATRTTFVTSTVTLSELAERVKALIDDLHATAGHGLIGT